MSDKKPPRVRIDNSEGIRWDVDCPEETKTKAHHELMAALGTDDSDFYNYIMQSLLVVSARTQDGKAKPDDDRLNFMLAVVRGVKPRDQVEAMLATQMAGVHLASMNFTWRLLNDQAPQQLDMAERTLNKLARTFATQMEALKRYRATGAQRVEVHHHHHNHQQNVTVEDGGQAIVAGALPGGVPEIGEQPHAKPVTHAPLEALPGKIEAIRSPVRLASG